MKKLILALFISFGALNYNYAQFVLWADSAEGSGNDEGRRISIDARGNVFVTGNFSSPEITFGNITLTNAGGNDLFIVKYDVSGNALWAKSAGGSNNDAGYGISTDASGNVFVTGDFYSPSITFGTTTLTNAAGGKDDMFIVKYDALGNVLWAKSAGGSSPDAGFSIATDATGNVFVTGDFYSSAITFGAVTLTNAGRGNIFTVKYDESGNVLWAKSGGGNWYDFASGIATDATGNVFVTGGFVSPAITFGTITLGNAGSCDIFIVKYDASGNVLWAKSEGGYDCDGGRDVSTDASGNVFVAGDFSSYKIPFGTTTFTKVGGNDIFIVKYDASGNVLWAKSAGGSGYDYGFGISSDAIGNVSVTGSFDGSTIAIDAITLTNADTSNADIFILQFDASGNIFWAKSMGGSGSDQGYGISTDGSGDVCVTGYFTSPTITSSSNNLTIAGYHDIFIMKLSGPVLTTVTGGNNNAISANVYPNPFFSSATLKLNMLNPAKATVALTDVTGKVVYYFVQGITMNAGENTFNYPENLLPGVYIVKVFSEDAVESLKCVKVEQ
jgi:Secretion system C-terminal sorting domain